MKRMVVCEHHAIELDCQRGNLFEEVGVLGHNMGETLPQSLLQSNLDVEYVFSVASLARRSECADREWETVVNDGCDEVLGQSAQV